MTSTLRQLGAEELRAIISQVLEDFAYLTALPAAVPAPELPICYRAELPGSAGWLVLRSTRELAGQLADASTGGSGEGLDEDAFIELCNLATSHLVSHIGQGRKQGWKAFVPQAGVPQGKATISVLLDVEGQPLEASIWKAA